MTDSGLTIRIATALADVDPAKWDACANPAELDSTPEAAESISQKERYNPFISHAFLNCCEASGSTGPRTGWTPAHVLVEDASGALLACAPTYLKTHSQGEYVFDHGWADAWHRAVRLFGRRSGLVASRIVRTPTCAQRSTQVGVGSPVEVLRQ